MLILTPIWILRETRDDVIPLTKFSDYKKPRRGVREIDLASYFKVGQTIANLTESERDLVNELLRRSLGKNPK